MEHSMCQHSYGKSRRKIDVCEYVWFCIIFIVIHVVHCIVCACALYFLFAFFPHFTLLSNAHTLCCVVLYCTVCTLWVRTHSIGKMLIFFFFHLFFTEFRLYCNWLCAFAIAWICFLLTFSSYFFSGEQKKQKNIMWITLSCKNRAEQSSMWAKNKKTKFMRKLIGRGSSSTSGNNNNKIQ